MKQCSVSDCLRQSKRSPLCKWHYKQLEKKLKKMMADFNISRPKDHKLSIDFSSTNKTEPEEYMKIIHRISSPGEHCAFNDCSDGGSYLDLCPSHNREIRRYYRAEADIADVKKIGKLLSNFKKEVFP